MTLTEKYIRKILPKLAGAGEVQIGDKDGMPTYSFPCPFCSHLTTSSGKLKERKRTAILLPHQDCKYEYVFSCRRGYSPECKGSGGKGGRNFLNFLIMLNPYLAEKYKFEKLHT